jgi:hypothetical protein
LMDIWVVFSLGLEAPVDIHVQVLL